ncbi:hypothetical protein EV426DRAFT_712107 [Tirmania nivea]|nr:hypothetical protein EV426DRAFT_712107 [Tirmania nivea]
MLVHMIVRAFDRQPRNLLQLLPLIGLYIFFLLPQCADASPTGAPSVYYPEPAGELPTAEQSEARMEDNAVVSVPTSTLELIFNGVARKAWWWHTAQRAELTEVPTDNLENWWQTWPQHTTAPPIPSPDAELSSKYSQRDWDLYTPHLVEAGATAVMDEAASLELDARISSMYHLTDLPTPGYTPPFSTRGPITSQELPHPRYRTLSWIPGEWPPRRLADTTHTPFINHNSNFPGHTFTVNGTLSVATCAFGYPKGDHCPAPTPISEAQFRLLNNERDPARPWEPEYPRPTQEAFPRILGGTKWSSSSSNSRHPSNGSNEKDSSHPKVATDRVILEPQNPNPTSYQWDPAEWSRTNWYWEYLDLATRTTVNGHIDQQALPKFQSPRNTLQAPFVLVPRPIDTPLGGNWREYCYSTLVGRYPAAAIFVLDGGVLEDYDGNRWEFTHDSEIHHRSCLQRVPLVQEWPSEGVAHPEELWNVFEATWVKFNGELEFWVCPNLGERETIGIGDAARPLMMDSTVCRRRVEEYCELKGLEIVTVKDC